MNKMHGMNAVCDLASLTSVNIDKADAVLNELFESHFVSTSNDAFQIAETYSQVQNLVMVIMDYITDAKKQANELMDMLLSQKRAGTAHE